mmetsp:Transcript_3180/g.6008  ORF Transcript_3180/g.6008 Transcript_3180/m.6008 type:complete len:127 (-) Transcript_3180:232-612(-)
MHLYNQRGYSSFSQVHQKQSSKEQSSVTELPEDRKQTKQTQLGERNCFSQRIEHQITECDSHNPAPQKPQPPGNQVWSHKLAQQLSSSQSESNSNSADSNSANSNSSKYSTIQRNDQQVQQQPSTN